MTSIACVNDNLFQSQWCGKLKRLALTSSTNCLAANTLEHAPGMDDAITIQKYLASFKSASMEGHHNHVHPIYVCMYVCINVCMYVLMYVCMDVWMYGCMDVWM